MASNVQPCVHQLRAELVHEKRTKEKFFVSTSVALPFAHAFSATTVCVPFPSSSSSLQTNSTNTSAHQSALVQTVLTSTAGEPVTISNYALKGPATILHDPNARHLLNTTILPNQRSSFVFSVDYITSAEQRDLTLEVTFTIPSPIYANFEGNATISTGDTLGPTHQVPYTTHSFSAPVSLTLPTPQYIIETRNPATAYLAQPIPFELLVKPPSSPHSCLLTISPADHASKYRTPTR